LVAILTQVNGDGISSIDAAQDIGLHCTKRAVGEPIMTNPYAFPISSHAAFALGYWVSDLKMSGAWAARLSQYTPVNTCAEVVTSRESDSLEPIHMVGAFLTTGLMIVLSLVASAHQQYTKNNQANQVVVENDKVKPVYVAEQEIEDVNKALDLLAEKLNNLRPL
jgi:hypothetical protein